MDDDAAGGAIVGEQLAASNPLAGVELAATPAPAAGAASASELAQARKTRLASVFRDAESDPSAQPAPSHTAPAETGGDSVPPVVTPPASPTAEGLPPSPPPVPDVPASAAEPLLDS